jgi:hypothetical protein
VIGPAMPNLSGKKQTTLPNEITTKRHITINILASA